MLRKDLLIAPALEAALILTVSLAGWMTHQPLVFASLGPTAFELIETPDRPSARPYNIILGNLIAIFAGYSALLLTHAWAAPAVSMGGVPLPRVGAATLAAMLTVFLTLLVRANQPAGISTALLISTGVMQTWHDGAVIMAAVLLMTAIGDPIRRWRARTMGK